MRQQIQAGSHLLEGNTKKVQWKCTGHLKNKDSCDALPITDEDLKVAYLTMLNKLIFGHKLVLEPFMKSLNKAGANQEGLEVLADEIDKIQEKLEVLASLTASSILSTKVSLEEQANFNKRGLSHKKSSASSLSQSTAKALSKLN